MVSVTEGENPLFLPGRGGQGGGGAGGGGARGGGAGGGQGGAGGGGQGGGQRRKTGGKWLQVCDLGRPVC